MEHLPGPRTSRRTAEARHTLTAEAATAITAAARRLGLTPGVLAQAAWAALLGHAAGSQDVVHGSAFSGRPADLPGADRIAGPFVNNLPVRSQLEPALPVTDFLRQIHGHLTDLAAHQFTPLPRIQDCTAVPWRFRLFESILVFQNYQVDDTLTQLGPQTTLTDFDGPIHTNYPLTLVVTPKHPPVTPAHSTFNVQLSTFGVQHSPLPPSPPWDLLLVHQEATCSAPRARQILTSFTLLLQSFAATPEAPLSTHLAALPLPANTSPAAPPLNSQPSTLNSSLPRTAMEHRLAAIWQRAFGLSSISTTDNFFDLGGHSLLMLRVHSAISQDLQRPLPITALFQYPTIASLAAHLDTAPLPHSPATLSPNAAAPNALQNRANAARAAAQRAAAARR